MARLLLSIVMVLGLWGLCLAQTSAPSAINHAATGAQAAQPESAAASQTATPRIAPGSVIPVELTKTIDAKKAKTGEEVTAKVTQDLKASNGMMLMPKDTEIVGRVTEAQVRNKQDKESEVGIVFDQAVTNTGKVSYPLSIQAVISPQALNPSNSGNAGASEAPSSAIPAPTPDGAGRGMGGGRAAPTNMPPANTPPANTPPANTPPANTPPANTPPANTPPANTPPANTPPANTPPGETGGETSGSGNQRPAITGQTQGIVGFSHLKLSTPSNPTQASVISSEKNNVKLENGTLMLLRVDQNQ